MEPAKEGFWPPGNALAGRHNSARDQIRAASDKRFALSLDGLMRYVGTRNLRERRAAILSRKNDRATEDKALGDRSI